MPSKLAVNYNFKYFVLDTCEMVELAWKNTLSNPPVTLALF